MRTRAIITAGLVLGLVAALDAGRATAAVVKVAANGIDSATCGKAAQPPCRTLTQAVANANTGDTIQVAPGGYPGATISKRLIVVSTNGAGVTTLADGVSITASGTIFGKMGKGFTLTSVGLKVLADDVQVTDNVAAHAGDGFLLNNNHTTMKANQALLNAQGIFVVSGNGHELIGNVLSRNGSGLAMIAGNNLIIKNNTAIGNTAIGFQLAGSGHVVQGNVSTGNNGAGFSGSADNVHLLQNIALGNATFGYNLTGGSGWVLTGNLASANHDPGFSLSGPTTYQLTGNVAIGSIAPGIVLSSGLNHVVTGNHVVGNTPGIELDGVGIGVVIHKNNLFGNGGCGITNNSVNTVDATNNFWGAASGPGPAPADDTCGTGVTDTAPVAIKAFFIKLPVLP